MSFSSHQDDAFVRSIKAIVDRTNLSQAEVLLGRSRRSISRIVSGLRPKQIMADVWLRDRVTVVVDQLGLSRVVADSKKPKKAKKAKPAGKPVQAVSHNPADFTEEREVLDVVPAAADEGAVRAPAGSLLDDQKNDPENGDLAQIEQMCLAQDHVIQKLSFFVALLKEGIVLTEEQRNAEKAAFEANAALASVVSHVLLADQQVDPINPVKAFAHDIAQSSLIGLLQTAQEENNRLKAFLQDKARDAEALATALKNQAG